MAIRSVEPDRPAAGPPTVIVGAMRRRHLRGVLQIEHQVYPQPWTLGMFLSELNQRSSRIYLVARVENRVVGYVGLLRSLGDAHVTTLAVDPAWRGQGIGTRLVAAAARASIARGFHNLTLEVRVSNDTAKRLYRRFGFAPAGVRRAYYPDNEEDALVMWANDIESPGYARRLSEIEASLEGETVIDGHWL